MPHRLLALTLVFTFVALPTMRGQDNPGMMGPPPEIRALIEAVVAALNGTAAQFEAMANERFTPEYFKKQTADARATLHAGLKKRFGTMTRERVIREGPDAPLELNVRGSTGATGVIRLSIESAAPYRITAIDADGSGSGSGRDTPRSDTLPAPPINGGMTADEMSGALHSHLSKLAADGVLSGVALVAKDGRPVFERAYGFADRANRIPNTIGTRFNLGSINKTFTQTAIAQLAAQGKLAPADPLSKFLPNHPQEVSRSATIQQLLRHTAGIADFFGDEFARTSKDRFRTNADYYRLVSSLPPLFAPGARNQYCNGCYITLGAIIERVAGMSYERYVQDHIFARAHMRKTGYPQSDGVEPDVALGYTRRNGDGSMRSNVLTKGAAGCAAGGGYSTAADLLAYDNALRSGALMDVAPVILGSAERSAAGRLSGGLGIAGGSPGVNAVLESNGTWTVVVLTNLDPPVGERLGLSIARALGR
jgi:D-alanyl-D-alanine carboxypeptidase